MHIRVSCAILTCCDDCEIRDVNAEPLIITQVNTLGRKRRRNKKRDIIKCTDLFVSTLSKHNSKAHGPLHAE